ncbi:hypothetical protein N9Y42_10615, partial [Mariniblastus sp.]|nr:hypothetical protein [Mariniblastus sp.]
MPFSYSLLRRIVLAALFFLFAFGNSYGQTNDQQDIPNNQTLTIPMTPPEEALVMIELPAGF